jgi:hypothetical protein
MQAIAVYFSVLNYELRKNPPDIFEVFAHYVFFVEVVLSESCRVSVANV